MSTTQDRTALSQGQQELLRRRLGALKPAVRQEIEPRGDDEPAPLSFAQERVWFMEQLAPGTAAYLTPQVFHFAATLRPATIIAAWQAVLARHESLRMVFPADADGRPTVRVLSVDELLPLQLERLESEEAAAARTDEIATGLFELSTGPLFRAVLLDVAGTGFRLVCGMHHIVTDGWSNDVLLRELSAACTALESGREIPWIDRRPVQYGDFAAHQRRWCERPETAEHIDHWVQRLAAVPPLALPTDRPRPATQQYTGQAITFRIPRADVEALEGWARGQRATQFMALMTAYQIVLARFAGQWDFAVGAPVAGRSLPELDESVGMFVNMLPIRADLTPEMTVDEALAATRTRVLEALSHEQVPFERVVQQLGLVRDPSRPPLFQAMLVLQNYASFGENPDAATTSGTAATPAAPTVDWSPIDLPATRFELELHTHLRPDGDLGGRLVSGTSLFSSESTQAILDSFTSLLGRLPTSGAVRIDEIEILDEAQQATLAHFNAGESALAQHTRAGRTLTELIDTGLGEHPTAQVRAADGSVCSYAELSAAADLVADRLRRSGVGAGDVVGVSIARSIELITALVGVLRSGAAYLPLDPEYPVDRLTFMVQDSGALAVLADAGAAAILSSVTVPVAPPDADGLPLLRDGAALRPMPLSGKPTQHHEGSAADTAAAYVIYTSGSTGRPKGVVNEHRGIVARLMWMQERFGVGPGEGVLQKTPAGFDVSVWEFFWPLVTGANLVLAAPGGHRDPAHLRALIAENAVSVAHFVPSMLDIFLAELPPGDGAALPIRAVVCSGEELSAPTALLCLDALPQAELHNLYGPTEAAIDVSAGRCDAETIRRTGRVSIGGPVPGTGLHVLDEALRPVPVGATGQLYISGVQVARGYLNRAELTAERFVALPESAWTGGTAPASRRAYATGDQARWRPDGTLEFHGRLDGQVKLRGQRIELGEIEHLLGEGPGIRFTAAAVKESTAGDVRLVGYLVPELDADGVAVPIDLDAVRSRAVAALPTYMVPAHLVVLDSLPLSPNGKLDRGALPMPEIGVSTGEFVPPTPGAQQAIAAVWQEVLGVDKVGAADDFFALGGHSLLATQVVAKLRPVLPEGTSISVMDLFQHPTVAGLAALVESDQPHVRALLYELTSGRTVAGTQRSLVCVPYGGGSAVVYQPLADALPKDHRLYSIAIPGHDVGLDEAGLPFDELAERCTAEILEKVTGPVVLYGHCGVGGALIIEIARRIEASHRPVEAVYVGGIFPFARAHGTFARVAHWFSDRASNRNHSNWLKSMGVDLADLEPGQADRIISNMRRDGDHAEEHFTALLASDPVKLSAPIITVVGERDPITDYYLERYREWEFLTDRSAVVVLAEAGHFFLKYRAAELVQIITRTDAALRQPDAAGALPSEDDPQATWWLADDHVVGEPVSAPQAVTIQALSGATPPAAARSDSTRHDHPEPVAGDAPSAQGATPPRTPARPVPRGPGTEEPSMGRFLAIAAGQLTSTIGSQLAGWAIPIWILQRTGSLGLFGLTAVIAFLPVIVTSPIAGALADRFDRRRVIVTACIGATVAEVVITTIVIAENPSVPALFVLIMFLGAFGTVQRIAFTAAVPQLVPKRFIGHANGVLGIINGAGQLFVPIAAAGLYALIGLEGMLLLDVASYVIALGVLAVVRFPNRLGRIRKESFHEQVFGGFRLVWNNRHFRLMNIFFAVGNLLYAPALLLTPPLVLGFGSLENVAVIAAWEAAGGLLGGAAMAVWGGPVRRRMRFNLFLIGISGLFVMLTGLAPSMAPIAAGVLGTTFSLGLANGIYVTIIQTKVPQRYHGRVFAVGQTLAWSTFPIGFLVVPFMVQHWFQPWMEPGGSLADSVGTVIGTGAGRGTALAFVIFGAMMTLNAVAGLCIRALRDLDLEVPDSLPDDLIGLEELERTRGSGRSADAVREPDALSGARG
ncbi:MAG: amino acid adenylation domain-containing protein [Nakamurella sp.]